MSGHETKDGYQVCYACVFSRTRQSRPDMSFLQYAPNQLIHGLHLRTALHGLSLNENLPIVESAQEIADRRVTYRADAIDSMQLAAKAMERNTNEHLKDTSFDVGD
ncbi:hypothetical protein TWF173_009052 [Orbilia oligospora]|nr:hypothetical protein TWF173_009052 [Orbilia oligospora]